MRYVSTRGKAPELSFREVLLEGLARDGGLYMPAEIPVLSSFLIKSFKDKSYKEIAFDVMKPYVEADLSDEELRDLIARSYSKFHHPDITPLHKLEDDFFVLELFHGPTLAFKDVALQFLGNLFEWALKDQDPITIIGATSGDTGSAAIEGCRGHDKVRLFITHPHERVSTVQRKQMTSVIADNIYNIAVKGTFDDCQNLVKDLFNDETIRTEMRLSAINSINWARICAQIPYYFYAASRLKKSDTELVVTVPTGNFGNVFAGILAKKMGAPIDRFIIATNENDSVHHCLETGEMRTGTVKKTLSPSMDIQISSNFERLLYLELNRDTDTVSSLMEQLKKEGSYKWTPKLSNLVTSYSVSNEETKETIGKIYEEYGYMADPHTATGLFASAQDYYESEEGAVIYCSLGCAHPAKFPDAILHETERKPALPDFLSDLYERAEKLSVLDNDKETLISFMRQALDDKN